MGVATIAIAVAAIAAALLAAADGGGVPQTTTSVRAHSTVRADLARCRALGSAGPSDPVCQATWAAQRERFFGKTSRPTAAASPEESGR